MAIEEHQVNALGRNVLFPNDESNVSWRLAEQAAAAKAKLQEEQLEKDARTTEGDLTAAKAKVEELEKKVKDFEKAESYKARFSRDNNFAIDPGLFRIIAQRGGAAIDMGGSSYNNGTKSSPTWSTTSCWPIDFRLDSQKIQFKKTDWDAKPRPWSGDPKSPWLLMNYKDLCLEFMPGAENSPPTNSPRRLDPEGKKSQEWLVSEYWTGWGWYSFKHVRTGKCLEIRDGDTLTGQGLRLNESRPGEPTQMFAILSTQIYFGR